MWRLFTVQTYYLLTGSLIVYTTVIKLRYMKKMFFLVLLTTGSIILFAQNDKYRDKNRKENVPAVVQQSYQRDYPNYNNSTWDRRNNEWHTRYMDRDHGNRYVDVYYDRNGRRMLAQSDWDRDNVPVPVRDRIRKRYHDENYNVYRIERPGRGILFQITFGGNNNRKVYYDERGREVRYTNRY